MKCDFNINDFKEEKNENILIPVFIILVLIIGLILVLCKFNINIYSKNTLIKEDGSYILIVNSDDISDIENNSNIYINNKLYKYKIEKIDDNYNVIDNIIYQAIYLNITNYDSNTKLVKVSFLKSSDTIFSRIYNFLRGG